MLQVHQVSLIAPGKALPLQRLLHLLEGGGGRVYAGAGVEHQLPPQPLDVENGVDLQLHRAPPDGHGDTGVLFFLHILQRPPQPLGKGKVAHRLQDVVQGVHRIALDGVLGQVGDKDNDHLRVLFPDIARRRHAVHEGHLHVHQDQVEPGLVPLHQVLAVAVVGDLEGPARLPAVVADVPLQLGKALRVVLRDGDSDHCAHSSPWPFLYKTTQIV